MKICGTGKFCIYIRGLDHPPPHCHVRFGDGSEVCVTLPLIEPMYGATITKEVREVIIANLEELTEKWDELHPKRKYRRKKIKTAKKKIK